MVLICLMGKQIFGGGGNLNYILKHCMANFFNEISVYQKLFLKLI